MTNNTISNEAALAILNDFNWHHRIEFIPLTRHITPEAACRAYVHAVPLKDRTTRIDEALDIKIRSGRSRIVDEYIRNLKRRKFVEVSGKGLEKQARLIVRVYIDHTGRLVGDLKRCPCCDGKPTLTDVIRFDTREFRAECENCHIRLSNSDKQTVITAWNQRVTTSPPPVSATDADEIELLRQTNDDLTRQCARLSTTLMEAEASCAARTQELDAFRAAMQQFAAVIVV